MDFLLKDKNSETIFLLFYAADMVSEIFRELCCYLRILVLIIRIIGIFTLVFIQIISDHAAYGACCIVVCRCIADIAF